MDPLQTTRTRNGVLYAAEWPCCHDPLRLCPLFHDLLPRPPHGCASATTPHFELVPFLPSCSFARRTLGVSAFDVRLRSTHRAVAVRSREGCDGSVRLSESRSSSDSLAKLDAPLHPHSHPRTSESTLPLRPTARLVHIRRFRFAAGGGSVPPPRVLLHSPSSHLRTAPGETKVRTRPSSPCSASPQPSASMAPSDSRRG